MPTLEAPPAAPEPNRRNPEIARLMKRLSRRNPLHRVISAGFGVPFDLPETVPTLLNVLRSTTERKWRERTIPIMALGQATILPEQRLEVATVLGRILNGREESSVGRIMKRGFRMMGRLFLWISLIIGFRVALLELGLPFFLPNWLLFPLALAHAAMILFTPLLLMVSPLYDMSRARALRLEAARALHRLLLPESVGALARAARREGRKGRLAWSTLHALLPTLTPEHYGKLPSDTTPELCLLLASTNGDTYVKERLLEALGKVGDGRAADMAEHFAQKDLSSALREKAAAILPILRERRERENASSMLLRGASEPQTKPAELLRAASYVSTTEPEQLLRATLGPDNEKECAS